MKKNVHKNVISFNVKICIICFTCLIHHSSVRAQNYEAQSILYNTLLGGISACAGALINKNKEAKYFTVSWKGFVIGAAGGAIVYGGKKLNTLITNENNLGYAWLSRGVFYLGESVIENTAAGKHWWETWHYDIGFIRLTYDCKLNAFQPKIMPAAFGATMFLAYYGKLDVSTSLQSGVPTFRTKRIGYQSQLFGSTVTNAFLLNDSLKERNRAFYDTYAHELIHSFQFSEFSGVNQFFNRYTSKWEKQSTTFRKIHKWVYGDLNHELMVINYFVVQGGVRRNYCKNFLENEAEYLSIGRSACEGLPKP